MTVDRIFERVNVLSSDVHRLKLALSRGSGNAGAEAVQAVQGQVVEEARPGQCHAWRWSGWMEEGEEYGELRIVDDGCIYGSWYL